MLHCYIFTDGMKINNYLSQLFSTDTARTGHHQTYSTVLAKANQINFTCLVLLTIQKLFTQQQNMVVSPVFESFNLVAFIHNLIIYRSDNHII